MEAGSLVEYAVYAILMLYNWLTTLIRTLLESTVFKERPDLASEFANSISILASVTAIYMILELFEGLKKLLRLILILGWGLLLIALVMGGVAVPAATAGNVTVTPTP